MRVLVLFGTRPEAIKMAPVVRELALHPGQIEPIVCVTGQHRQMLDQVLEIFDIRPDFDLGVMRPDQTLTQLTASLLPAIEEVLLAVKPDVLLVQGDTTTVMAASLVAHYHRVRIGHVEAGLRTGDKFRPFPEETNRRVTDVVADYYFAPTATAQRNLLAENTDPGRIFVTGNTVIDALLHVASLPYEWSTGPLAGIPSDREIVTVTAHRRESFGEPFREMCGAIRDLAEEYAGRCHVVYPVHLNPRVQRPVRELLAGNPDISLIEPLDYLSFVHLLKRSRLVLTDSGGVQEEAPALDVPVLVMRDATERPEGIESGTSRLVGTSRQAIVDGVRRVLDSAEAHAAMASAANPFGDGHAARRIVEALLGSAELAGGVMPAAAHRS